MAPTQSVSIYLIVAKKDSISIPQLAKRREKKRQSHCTNVSKLSAIQTVSYPLTM